MGACLSLHKYDNKYNEFNQTNFLAAHFAKRNTKFGGGGKKLESESEGGQKFLPPNPLPFCPPERLDFKIRNSDFRQKMFELRPKNTAKIRNSNFRQKYGRREAPSVLHSPQKTLIQKGFSTLRVARRLPIQFYE